MVLFRSDVIAVRRLTPLDFPKLVKWLSDSRVLTFYEGRDRPHDIQKVQQVFGSKLSESVAACIVTHHEKEIGYIQFYPVSDEDKARLCLPLGETAYGMDQFIGEPEYWNQGIGTHLVHSMARHLIQTYGAQRVIMDPQAWNTRAIRAYEKAGFRKMRSLPAHELHEGQWRDCWLMCYTAEP